MSLHTQRCEPDDYMSSGGWRCECGDLNRGHEAFCYRCGAGQPDEPLEGTLVTLLRECQSALTGPADLRQRIEDVIGPRKRTPACPHEALIYCPQCIEATARTVDVKLSAYDAKALLDAWYGDARADHRAAEAAARRIEDALVLDDKDTAA